MARPKEFDRAQALERALDVFWDQGYEGTSTDDLLRAMGIGRQSLYDTYGDKHGLFVEALQRYNERRVTRLEQRLSAPSSPVAALAAMLEGFATESAEARARGCLGVKSTSELGQADTDVAAVNRAAKRTIEALLERGVAAAQEHGEVPKSVDPRAAARFLLSAMHGLRVSAMGGSPPSALREIAQFAMRSLTAS